VKRGNGNDRDDPTGAEEGDAAAAEPEKKEESGLTGVDAPPLAPLTREEVEALRRERDELADQLLRKRAEFDNFRKRVERDRQAAGLEAAAAILQELIPTLDNLDRALEAPPDPASLREGVEMIRRGLLALLESKGVTVEDPKGAMFDPSRHQALSHEPVPGHAEGTVVEVYRKGYSFRDRLLRPALVKVAKAAAPETPSDVHSEPEKVH
jgi:molecular chaperone GrpE